jgi:hypothetical protein
MAKNLSFCYLCGQPFKGFTQNEDHVPPDAVFLKVDRNPPLKLPTHNKCNQDQSVEDGRIGNLFRLLRGEAYKPERGKLLISEFQDKPEAMGVHDLDIRGIIRRWVRGFHAALYRTFLPEMMNFSTSPPLSTADENYFEAPLPETHLVFVETLKRNRITGTVDRIICRNNTCLYESVWVYDDQKRWMCIFGLDLYGWIRASPSRIGLTPRGCVGAYWMPDRSCPILGTQASTLYFPYPINDILNPFGT